MRRIVGISVAATLALPLMVVGVGSASATQQDVAARPAGLLGSGDNGLLGTGLLGSDRDDRKDRKKSKSKKSKRDRRDRDHQANSIAGLNLLGDGSGDLLGLGGDGDGLLGTGLLGDGDGLLGTGLLGDGDGLLGTGLLSSGDRDRDRDRHRNGTKRHYDNRDNDRGSDLDDDDFPFGDD